MSISKYSYLLSPVSLKSYNLESSVTSNKTLPSTNYVGVVGDHNDPQILCRKKKTKNHTSGFQRVIFFSCLKIIHRKVVPKAAAFYSLHV